MTEINNNQNDPNIPAFPVGTVLPLYNSLELSGEYNPVINGYRHVYYGENNVAVGWLPCDGRTVSKLEFPETFNLIGYTYGGSGNSFALPNILYFFIKMDYKIQ